MINSGLQPNFMKLFILILNYEVFIQSVFAICSTNVLQTKKETVSK